MYCKLVLMKQLHKHLIFVWFLIHGSLSNQPLILSSNKEKEGYGKKQIEGVIKNGSSHKCVYQMSK